MVGGLVRQRCAGVDFIPQSGIYEFGFSAPSPSTITAAAPSSLLPPPSTFIPLNSSPLLPLSSRLPLPCSILSSDSSLFPLPDHSSIFSPPSFFFLLPPSSSMIPLPTHSNLIPRPSSLLPTPSSILPTLSSSLSFSLISHSSSVFLVSSPSSRLSHTLSPLHPLSPSLLHPITRLLSLPSSLSHKKNILNNVHFYIKLSGDVLRATLQFSKSIFWH